MLLDWSTVWGTPTVFRAEGTVAGFSSSFRHGNDMSAQNMIFPMNDGGFDMTTHPIHLGLGGTSTRLPTFTGDMAWYENYGATHAADGNDGRLCSIHTFTDDWGEWEVHPEGHELVVCLDGVLRLHQEHPDGSVGEVTLRSGEAVINDPGVWHTADVVEGPVRAFFITAGLGTEGRPR